MQGCYVPRQAGWDCHGLPVEVAVEKELGLSGKKDIEAYGIAAFNQRCRESVLLHVDAFEELTDRLGYWSDLSSAYRTMDASYVESVWWSLKEIFRKGLLVKDYRISPYCPRCETALSDHEMGQPDVYRTVTEQLMPRVLGEGWHVAARLRGSDLVGATYRPPFGLVDIPGAHLVLPGTFVTTEDGTGLVHLSPAFGADDMETSRAHGLPVVNPIRPDGRFEESVPLVGGLFFKDADEPLVRDLSERGLLFHSEPIQHSYPHCWRCHTPLLYYALPSWFIRTTQIKDRLLAENERTNWQPPTIKHGRYGEWLRNNVDWALSRTRYWGTPLPLWECGEHHLTCAGSLA